MSPVWMANAVRLAFYHAYLRAMLDGRVDEAANLDCFKRAAIHIYNVEMAYVTGHMEAYDALVKNTPRDFDGLDLSTLCAVVGSTVRSLRF